MNSVSKLRNLKKKIQKGGDNLVCPHEIIEKSNKNIVVYILAKIHELFAEGKDLLELTKNLINCIEDEKNSLSFSFTNFASHSLMPKINLPLLITRS